ncbi:hypothetical protein DFH06DRAFT_1003795 [Mycena polygramma]|nr:hypothetical protein DFH06DRAFT_1003795 [Mycena polygramma]
MRSHARANSHPDSACSFKSVNNGHWENQIDLAGVHRDTLAAELERAHRNTLDRKIVDERDNGKNHSNSAGLDPGPHGIDIDTLRSEVKSLKDSNKALSLLASKIIDRIISQDGFEHVLAVDYEKEFQTLRTTFTAVPNEGLPAILPARPQSAIGSRSNPTAASGLPTSPKIGKPPSPKARRRSLSFYPLYL